MRPARLLLPLLLLASPAFAAAQDTRPLAVGEGHGFDPGAKRRAPSPIDDEEATPAPPRPPILPTVIEHGRRDLPLVALTFDACPSTVEHGGFRRDIVEFLRREQIPATLLVSSKWAKWRPEVVEELAADPLFEIETHGGAHVDMRRYEPEKMRHELERSIAVIHQLTGRTPQYFRPPRGAWDDTLAHEAAGLGLAILQFDVVSADAEASFRPERIVQNVLSAARPGSIVVLHMNGPAKHTLDALPAIVAGLRARGLGFAKVSQLVGEEEASVDPALALAPPAEPPLATPAEPPLATPAPAPAAVAAPDAVAVAVAAPDAVAVAAPDAVAVAVAAPDAVAVAAPDAVAVAVPAPDAVAVAVAAPDAVAVAVAAPDAVAVAVAAPDADAVAVAAPAPTPVSIAPLPAAPAALSALSAPAAVEHVLQRGERVTDLATRYGSTSADILRANGITDPRRLQPGLRLVIPLTRKRR